MRIALKLIGLAGLLATLVVTQPVKPAPPAARRALASTPGAPAEPARTAVARVMPSPDQDTPPPAEALAPATPRQATPRPPAPLEVSDPAPPPSPASGALLWLSRATTAATAAVTATREVPIGSSSGRRVTETGPAAAPVTAPGAAWDDPAVLEVLGVGDGGRVIRGRAFPKDLVRYLRILVWWNVAGTHAQRLELFAPDGSLYQRFSAQFDADNPSLRQPFGQSVRTPVETRLLVGGTWITEHGLFGAWRVDVYLDSGSTPNSTASFVLSP
jgi:hypothetical protein